VYGPTSKAEAVRYRYGKRSSQPQGVAYDPARCAAAVWGQWRGMIEAQCQRRAGHGPDALFCKQHAEKLGER